MLEENTFEYRAEVLYCHGCRAIHRADVQMSGKGAKENPLAGAVHGSPAPREVPMGTSRLAG